MSSSNARFSVRRFFRRLTAWRIRRELRRRPGHFTVRVRKKGPRFPWRKAIAASFALIVLAGSGSLGFVMMDDGKVATNTMPSKTQLADSRSPAPPPLPDSKPTHIEGRVAKLLHIAMLHEALVRLDGVSTYTATFERQERVGDELLDGQTMFMKMRHEPFSVFLNVTDGAHTGRQIIYPKADDDPRMLVQLTRFGGRLPAIPLEPTSALAMKECRYPITMAGIKEITKQALDLRQRELAHGPLVTTMMRDDASFDGRPAYEFTVEYDKPELSEASYRRCEIHIDAKLMVPVQIRNWTWAELVPDADPANVDESTLLEHYVFRNVDLDIQLDDTDFDCENEQYAFR